MHFMRANVPIMIAKQDISAVVEIKSAAEC